VYRSGRARGRANPGAAAAFILQGIYHCPAAVDETAAVRVRLTADG